MSATRRPIQFNPSARSWTAPPITSAEAVDKFHREFPAYQPTPLISLPSIADELNVGAVYIKDEGNRFGLPAFKILGASWGSFRAVAQKLNLPIDSDLDTVKKAAASQSIKLYACTEGNHGRAVARMGAILCIPVEIHVPPSMYLTTRELIASEGATIVVSTKTYDDAVIEAQAAAKTTEGGIFVQDSGIEGYEEIPQWIVDGYSTLMREVDQQLGSTEADLVVGPVGVGSFAQAVVSHFRRAGSNTRVLTYEPDTAACLYKNLRSGKFEAVQTTPTIMAGLNCGLLSTIGWPLLKAGVDATVTVSDFEAHQAVQHLETLGVFTGPCGAGSLAALRRLSESDKASLGLNKDSTIVLLSTEGTRKYEIPLDVSSDDPITLTQTLVQINSASPGLGSIPGPGEAAIAKYIAHWLEHRDIEVHKIEPTPGRPSIVGVARGTGGGKSLMFNGHIDTVTLVGYEDDPLSGEIKDGKLYGRGSADMKCGVAAAMVATANAKRLQLRGDVIFTGVADEEDQSIGTEQVLAAGWRADAALVNEPTQLEIVHAHRGFVWFEVNIHGVASHGSRPDLGVDAISKAGYFLAELDRYAKKIQQASTGKQPHQIPSLHASMIKGGEEASSYPAQCNITVEYRTIAGQTTESVTQELRDILEKLVKEVDGFKYDIKVAFERQPFELSIDDPFTQLVSKFVKKAIGKEPTITGGGYWTDCALLAQAGIKSLLYGPFGEGFHAKEEWVDVESIRQVAQALTEITAEFCK